MMAAKAVAQIPLVNFCCLVHWWFIAMVGGCVWVGASVYAAIAIPLCKPDQSQLVMTAA